MISIKTQTAAAQPGSLSDDLLKGVEAIGAEIGEDRRRTYYLLEQKLIPSGKIGALWVASRRKLRAHYDKATGGNAA